MDTCVVIPPEFSLILSTDLLDLFEMRVGLWSNTFIERGSEFFADQGDVRLDKLEVYGLMKDNDVRKRFGCVDQIEKRPDRQVRHCNWVRFLKPSQQVEKINLLASQRDDKFLYKAVRDIPANTELIGGFDEDGGEFWQKVIDYNQPGDQVTEDEVEAENEVDQQTNDSDIEVDSCFEQESNDPGQDISIATSTGQTGNGSTICGQYNNCSTPSGNVGSRNTPPSVQNQNELTPESDGLDSTTDSGKKSLSSSSFVSDISPNSTCSSLIGSGDHVFTPPSSRGSRGPIMVQRPAMVCVSSPFKHVPILNKYRLFEPRDEDVKFQLSGEESVVSSSPSTTSYTSTSPLRTPVKRNRERTWLPCEICGKKFDRPSLLRRHIRTHTGEKPHACDICGKAFSTSSSLNTHRRIHSGEKPHQCRVCGKRFTASSNLYYHRMTHNKEKPHKCNLCSKSFPTPGDLKSHMYVHNGSWPYRCEVCDRGFSKQTNLKNHMLLHTGDKPHECSLCGKRFALQCNLRTHQKTHESETQEECFKCGKVWLTTQQKLTNGYCDSCTSQISSKSPVKGHHQHSTKTGTNFHSINDIVRSENQKGTNGYFTALTSPQWSRSPMIMPLLGMGLGGRYVPPTLLQMAGRDSAKNQSLSTGQNYTSALWMANGYRV